MIKIIKKQNLNKIYEIVCANFPYWFACAVFMLPSIPVTIIFQEIMKIYIGEIISQGISFVIFLVIISIPIFLIPISRYTDCNKKKRKTN